MRIGDRHTRTIGDRHMRSSRNNLAFNALELLVVYLSPWRCPHRTANWLAGTGGGWLAGTGGGWVCIVPVPIWIRDRCRASPRRSLRAPRPPSTTHRAADGSPATVAPELRRRSYSADRTAKKRWAASLGPDTWDAPWGQARIVPCPSGDRHALALSAGHLARPALRSARWSRHGDGQAALGGHVGDRHNTGHNTGRMSLKAVGLPGACPHCPGACPHWGSSRAWRLGSAFGPVPVAGLWSPVFAWGQAPAHSYPRPDRASLLSEQCTAQSPFGNQTEGAGPRSPSIAAFMRDRPVRSLLRRRRCLCARTGAPARGPACES